jgi:hypothetical protein
VIVDCCVFLFLYIQTEDQGPEHHTVGSFSGLENRPWESVTLTTRHPSIRKKLTLTSPTSGGRSFGIILLRSKATEFSFFVFFTCFNQEMEDRSLHTYVHMYIQTYMLIYRHVDIRIFAVFCMSHYKLRLSIHSTIISSKIQTKIQEK